MFEMLRHRHPVPGALSIIIRKRIVAMMTRGQGWKPGYLALECQSQFRCVKTQMSGFSFGLVTRLLKNMFQFRFKFCLHTTSVSGFQFRFKFHPRKLFYFEQELFKCSISWRFCLITMINCSSDDRVRRAIDRKCRFRCNSEFGETKDSKISIHSFSISRSELKELYW